MQKKFGKPKTSPSSNVGRSVWVQAFKKTDQGDAVRCLGRRPGAEECGGTVRYDNLGYKVCEDCGLVQERRFP